MQFTGRITADARISIAKGDKELVSFTVAINDRYRPKGSTETKQFTTYINVAWWKGTGITKILRKAAIVTISGRIYPNAYSDMQGNPKASINCHASQIDLVQAGKNDTESPTEPANLTEPVKDLPF